MPGSRRRDRRWRTKPLVRARLHALLACLAVPAAVLLGGAAPLRAQPFERPVQERPELPPYAGPKAPEPLQEQEKSLLPPLPTPQQPELRVQVRGYRVRGVTVFSREEISAVLQPWLGREIGSEDLVAMRNAITELYVKHGYLNSGAVIPDQDMADGNVEIVVLEGGLTRIDVSGTEHYRPGVLRDRIAAEVPRPLKVQDIERALQLLQQDPRIERVHARLSPGERVGEAVLSLRVEEASPYRISLQGSNYAPVAFGSYQGQAIFADDNLLGFGDTVESRLRVSGGLVNIRGDYSLPVGPYGTELLLRGEYSSSTVLENEFNALDIDTDYYDARIGIEHPLYRSERSTLKAGLMAEWRRASTSLAGTSYSFAGSGGVDGKTTVAPLRLLADFLLRERNQVVAARSLLSVGLPVLGARSSMPASYALNPVLNPDGQFVVWLGQLQWARRFSFLDLQTIFRTDVQLASDALPTLEQLTVGGHLTVRGYRENQQIRDQGVISSLELRVPLWQQERPILEIAPFADFGWSDNVNRPTVGERILASVGLGLRWAILPNVRAQVYWGYQLQDTPTSGDLQDDGVQFSLTWDAF